MDLYLVVGMHRSGTSAATRVLNLLGPSLGDEDALMQAKPDNVTGFWEVRKVAGRNERLLNLYGGTWDAPPVLPDGWQDDDRLTSWRRRLREELAVVVDGSESVAIKDPRMSLTLPAWTAAAPAAGVLLPIRHPYGVAQSLQRRNGIDAERAAYLWLRYNAAAVANSEVAPVVVDYPELLADPVAVAERMADSFGLPAPDAATREQIAGFVDRDLDHQDAEGAPDPGPLMTLAQEYYGALRSGESGAAARAVRTRLRALHLGWVAAAADVGSFEEPTGTRS